MKPLRARFSRKFIRYRKSSWDDHDEDFWGVATGSIGDNRE